MSIIVDSVAAIQRLTKDSDNVDKESYVINAALQAIKCNIQPASPEQTAIAEGVFGQTYIMFTTESGILVGDKVTVSGTAEVFRVKGKENWDADPLSHYEVTLVRWEEEEV